MLRSLTWWQSCTLAYSERRCLYGAAPPDLPPLDRDACLNGANTSAQAGNEDRCYDTLEWRHNTAARLRIGLYDAFIADWLSVFSKHQLLVISYEDFIADGVGLIQNVIYPFLDVPKLPAAGVKEMRDLLSHKSAHGRGQGELLPHIRTLLNQFYAPYNKRLAARLGDDKWLWRL